MHAAPSTRASAARAVPRRRRHGAELLLVALLGCAGSDEPPVAAAAAAPAGTVLLVDDLALSAADIEPLCADIRALYPEYSPEHVRRLALTNEYLPRLAARAADPERWNAAREACERARPPAAGADGDDAPLVIEGRFPLLGVGLWSAARHLPPGEWSGALELAGRFVRLRLDSREDVPDPVQETLRVSVLEFPYVPRDAPHVALQAAIDRARLSIVDPTYEEIVPESWKHRMRGPR